MIKIVDKEEEELEQLSYEEFQNLDFKEKLDFVTEWMIDIMRSITSLAEKISKQQNKRNEFGDTLKSLMHDKTLEVVKMEVESNSLIRDILKGHVSFYGRMEKR